MKTYLTAIAFSLAISGAASAGEPFSTTVDQVVYDHVGEPIRDSGKYGAPWGKHEANLNGVPERFDWHGGARPGSIWMDYENAGKRSLKSWGQVYEQEGGSPVMDVRVQIMQTLYAFADGKWVLVEGGDRLTAGHFPEEFGDREHCESPPERDESDNGGGQSFVPVKTCNIHYWVSKHPRAYIPENTEAFFTIAHARLIHNRDKSVDLNEAKFLLGVSADYYETIDVNESEFGALPSMSINRHRFLKPYWQTYTSYISGSKPATVDDYRQEILSRPLPPGVEASNKPIGKTIWLKSKANGKFISADLSLDSFTPPLVANRSQALSWENFTVVDAGDGLIALKALSNEKFVTAHNNDLDAPLRASSKSIQAWNRFDWILNDDGTISLQSYANDKFVVSEQTEDGAPLEADRDWARAWEKFEYGVIN